MPRDRYDDDDDRPRRRRDDDDDDRPRSRRRRDEEDDDDRPRRRSRRDDDDFDRPPPKKSGGGKVLFIVLGVVGVVVVLLVVGLFFALNLVRETAGRSVARNNQIQVGLALHSFTDVNGKFPGPFVDPPEFGGRSPANTADRLSWRVDLLPYLEQDSLFRNIQRGEAWNSPLNTPHTSRPVKPFVDPSDPTDANTRYRCFYDNGALFATNPRERVSFGEVKDGTSNTVMFVESADRVPWAQFNEFAFAPNTPPPALGHPSRNVFAACMADGSVKFVKKTVSPAALNAAITRAGGEVMDPEFR